MPDLLPGIGHVWEDTGSDQVELVVFLEVGEFTEYEHN